jgi:peptidyl-prolyl cis-trans isomerase SurA
MRKYLLVGVCTLLFQSLQAQKDPVLMTVGNKEITKSEFLQIYLKNNPNPKYDKATLDEYMELFKKFKLKVAEAERLQYDTLPKLKKELEGYRKQLSTPYLIDSAKNKEMVLEAYERTKLEIRASHILIRIEPNAKPSDTLVAYNRIMALKKRIDGGEDFEKIAKSKGGSEDPSVSSNGGDLGYFTAFQMVYPFEDAAYKTPVGKVSNPVRTRFGYHLIKVVDTRKARGTIKTAHIMVALPKNASPNDKEAAHKKATEIYEKLKAGENFEELVKQFSDDPGSSNKDGVLPPFGSGTTMRMVIAFEDAAFALKNDGDYSEPVETEYGFHIIKRLEWNSVPEFEKIKKDLQTKVNKDDRAMKTQDSYVIKLKNQYGYKLNQKNLVYVYNHVDTTIMHGHWSADNIKKNKTIFKLDGKKYKQQDFARNIEGNQKSFRKDDLEKWLKEEFIRWDKAEVLAYESNKLEEKYPDFKALMTEYHDGIILYEIMTETVWNKAITDTTGLKEFFKVNQANYQWKDRVDAVIYECASEAIAIQAYNMLQNDTITSANVLEVINKESELNLRVKTNKYELESTPYLKDRKLNEGVNQVFSFDGKYYVVDVNQILPAGPKELNEAKGSITSDYQSYIETEWIKELIQRHPIKINETVLYSLGK